MKVGGAIQRRRRAAGFSQEGFADHIAMHRSYFGAIERGEKNLEIGTLLRVAKGLKVRLSDVIREAEDSK